MGPWFQGRWPPHMQLNRAWGICFEWQELFPVVVACPIWFPHFSGKRMQFCYDHESVAGINNLGHSKALCIMDLLRLLILISMKHNLFVLACYIPGVSNKITEAFSCFQDAHFWSVTPKAEETPCTFPPSLMTLYRKKFKLTQGWD